MFKDIFLFLYKNQNIAFQVLEILFTPKTKNSTLNIQGKNKNYILVRTLYFFMWFCRTELLAE